MYEKLVRTAVQKLVRTACANFPISRHSVWHSDLKGMAITGRWSIPGDPLKVVQLRSMILIFAAKPGQKQRALQCGALVM